MIINGTKRNLSSRKYCIECVPFGSRFKKVRVCRTCGKELKSKKGIYCSVKCHNDYDYNEYIKRWKRGEENGTIGKAWVDTSSFVRRYIFEKYDNKCAKCGWSERNLYTNTIPLEIEHIDGNALNNQENNLTLLCPNCHSLTKTYRGANKGNGSRGIKWLSRDGLTTNSAD